MGEDEAPVLKPVVDGESNGWLSSVPHAGPLHSRRHARGFWRGWKAWSCLFVVAVAIGLRLPLVGFGLPNVWHPDEPTNVGVGAAMVDHNSWNPHFWAYPSLLFYVIALVGHLQRLVGGWVPAGGLGVENVGIGTTTDPHLFMALRLVTVVVSVVACVLVWSVSYVVTRRWWAATVAGLLIAVSPLMVQDGVYITPDAYSALFAAAAVLAAIWVLRRGRVVDYALSGAAVGLAAGSKYNAALTAVPVMVAHFLRYSKPDGGLFNRAGRGWAAAGRHLARDSRWLALAGVVAVVVFLITTPGAVTNTHDFIKQAEAQARLYAKGRTGIAGSSFRFYFSTFEHQGLLYGLLGIVGLAGALGRWWREWLVVALFTAGYVCLISVQAYHADRDFLLAMIGLAILSAIGLATLVELAAQAGAWNSFRTAAGAVTLVLTVGLLVSPVVTSAQLQVSLDQKTRLQARAWIEQHVAAGSTVVVDPYGPWLDKARFHLDEAPFVLMLPVSKLPSNAAAVVITQYGSGRFLADPKLLSKQVADYHQLAGAMCLGASFTDGPWIRVFVPCPRGSTAH